VWAGCWGGAPMQLAPARAVGPADLIGMAAEALRVEGSHGDRLAQVADVDRLELACCGNDRKERQPRHCGEAVGKLVLGAEDKRGADDGRAGEGLANGLL